MPDKERKKREAPISYRPPSELREEFFARVQKSGLSTSAFLTKAVFGQGPTRQSRRPAIEQQLLARLLVQAAVLRDRLHDIEAAQEGGDNALLIAQAVEELTVIRAALLKAMQRAP
jgi:hypothetical protein